MAEAATCGPAAAAVAKAAIAGVPVTGAAAAVPAAADAITIAAAVKAAPRTDTNILPPCDRLPIRHRAVFQSIDREIGALVRISSRQRLIDIHTRPGLASGVERALRESVCMREY